MEKFYVVAFTLFVVSFFVVGFILPYFREANKSWQKPRPQTWERKQCKSCAKYGKTAVCPKGGYPKPTGRACKEYGKRKKK